MKRNEGTSSRRNTGGPLLIILGTAMLFIALILGTSTPGASAKAQVTPVGTPVVETATASATVEITGTVTPVVTGTVTVVVTGTTTPEATITVTGTTTVEATATVAPTAEGTVTVVDTTPTAEVTVEATVAVSDTPTTEPTVEATPTSEGSVLPVSGTGSSGNDSLVFILLAAGVACITIGLAASFGRRRGLEK